ncbi:MAG: hypothetical protein AAF773_17925 [Cyanobacteria bacterium P01_D01_bin.115]
MSYLCSKAETKRLLNAKRITPLPAQLLLARALLVSSVACLGWLVVSPPVSASLARIHSILEGKVELRRNGWKNFQQAFSGTALYGDDDLRVTPGTEVILVCPDRTSRDFFPAGEYRIGRVCPGTPRRVRPTFGVSETWSARDANSPYVITPWSGQLLSATPTLRWNAVADAELYTVTLKRRAGDRWVEVWTVKTDQSVLAYPINQPELQFGEEYALQVNVGNEAEAVEEWSPTAVFSLMGGQQKTDAEAAIAAVNAMDAPDSLKTLILVEEVYPNYQLFAAGMHDLLEQISAGTETAQIHRLLGDYAIRLGLALPTETSYLKALSLAEVEANSEEQVRTQWVLGTFYNRVGELEKAVEYLEAAAAAATELGDTTLAEDIAAEISRSQ